MNRFEIATESRREPHQVEHDLHADEDVTALDNSLFNMSLADEGPNLLQTQL